MSDDTNPFAPTEPLIDVGQGPTLKKLSELGRYDTWAGALQALGGKDPKGPGGAQYTGTQAPVAAEENLDPGLDPGGGTHLESLDQGNQGAADVAGSKQMM